MTSHYGMAFVLSFMAKLLRITQQKSNFFLLVLLLTLVSWHTENSRGNVKIPIFGFSA